MVRKEVVTATLVVAFALALVGSALPVATAAGEATVGFRIEMVDVTSQEEARTSGALSYQKPSPDGVATDAIRVEPGAIEVQQGSVGAGLEGYVGARSSASTVKAWLMAAVGQKASVKMGRSGFLTQGVDWAGVEVAVEPLQVDMQDGKVICRVRVSSIGSQAQASAASQTLQCEPVRPVVAAMVRQPVSGGSSSEQRTFAVLVTAMPLGDGLSVIDTVGAGPAGPDSGKVRLDPKLRPSWTLGLLPSCAGMGFFVGARLGPAGLSFEQAPEGERTFRAYSGFWDLHARGMLRLGGLGGSYAFLGLGDEVRPSQSLRLSADVYPLTYQLERRSLSLSVSWDAKMRMGPDAWGLTLGAGGGTMGSHWTVGLEGAVSPSLYAFASADFSLAKPAALRVGLRSTR